MATREARDFVRRHGFAGACRNLGIQVGAAVQLDADLWEAEARTVEQPGCSSCFATGSGRGKTAQAARMKALVACVDVYLS